LILHFLLGVALCLLIDPLLALAIFCCLQPKTFGWAEGVLTLLTVWLLLLAHCPRGSNLDVVTLQGRNGGSQDTNRLEAGAFSHSHGWVSVSSKGQMLKAWPPAFGATERWWSFWEAGPSRRKLGHWGHALGSFFSLSLSLSLCFHEVSSLLFLT
jgi:hypothetical protein